MRIKKIVLWLIACFVVVLLGNIVLKTIFPLKYREVISLYAEKYSIPEELLQGVIYAESKFLADVHSGKAAGLMQITTDTAAWICDELNIGYFDRMLYQPEVNIKMGSYYLWYLIDHYGNIDTALAAYNAGMGNVSKWLEDDRYSSDGVTLHDIPYGETKRYVERVNKLKQIYKILY